MRSKNWNVVDAHTPMRQALEAERVKNPDFAFAKDGVHSGRAGHWVMASCILQQYFGDSLNGVTGAEQKGSALGSVGQRANDGGHSAHGARRRILRCFDAQTPKKP